jgi:hypothetical protein
LTGLLEMWYSVGVTRCEVCRAGGISSPVGGGVRSTCNISVTGVCGCGAVLSIATSGGPDSRAPSLQIALAERTDALSWLTSPES